MSKRKATKHVDFFLYHANEILAKAKEEIKQALEKQETELRKEFNIDPKYYQISDEELRKDMEHLPEWAATYSSFCSIVDHVFQL